MLETKPVIPKTNRKKILSLAILDIVNQNKSSSLKDDLESPLKTTWFVVKHPRLDSISQSVLGDLSLHSSEIKQVSPNWSTFLGYKTFESEKIPLSKFVPSRIEISPKTSSKWDALFEHTSRNNTLNYSCEFVLCHKFGLMFGVELQITTFSTNGSPDTSFVVIKKHWNLNNTNEASAVLNDPKIDVMSDNSMLNEEEEDEDADPSNDLNFELLRKAVDFKRIEMI